MSKELQWLVSGYKLVSEIGIDKFNVVLLASTVGSSKSSFYHFYGDFDNYLAALLTYHIQQTKELAIKIYACEDLDPDMINVFLENQEDILFHKQIRIKRENEACRKCFEKAYQNVEDAIFDKWIVHLELLKKSLFARAFLNLVSENFLLRITKNNFTQSWLANYVKEIVYLLTQIDSSYKK